MQRIQLGVGRGNPNSTQILGGPVDGPALDTAEQVVISSLPLLKMLKHGRAGVPLEVMGLMLGEFVDEYTVSVVDVFSMPQSGTGVSVDAIDPAFQQKMVELLKTTGRPENVVGWYHSHPGFGCWLSGVDQNTQQAFESTAERAVAVVIDPIQSVKGKVVIDAFRLINQQQLISGQEPRQTTSNLGNLSRPSVQAIIHGLNTMYYRININYRINELEQKMLLNLHKQNWSDMVKQSEYRQLSSNNEKSGEKITSFSKAYWKSLEDEEKMKPSELAVKNIGKQDPKRHIEEHVANLMATNIVQSLSTAANIQSFK